MTLHETITLVLALGCGFYGGLAIGYRQANREYKEAVDRSVEAMQNGGKVIEKLRQRLVAKRIVEMRKSAQGKETKP